MDSQFSDIRKEYKKGKLTRNTISENPFEQFAPLAQRRPALRRERTYRHDCSHRLTGRTALYPHRTAERRGKR